MRSGGEADVGRGPLVPLRRGVATWHSTRKRTRYPARLTDIDSVENPHRDPQTDDYSRSASQPAYKDREGINRLEAKALLHHNRLHSKTSQEGGQSRQCKFWVVSHTADNDDCTATARILYYHCRNPERESTSCWGGGTGSARRAALSPDSWAENGLQGLNKYNPLLQSLEI